MFGQVGQTKGVGDVAPAFADHAGDVAMRIAINLAQLGVAGGLLKRIEVGPLHVFDNGDFERFAVARLDDDDRDLVQPGPLRGPPAALASDDLVSIHDAGNGANDDRLDDPAFLDGGGEFIEFRIVETLARIARIGRKNSIGVWRAARAPSECCGFAPPSKAASPRPRRGRLSVRAESSAMGSFPRGMKPV